MRVGERDGTLLDRLSKLGCSTVKGMRKALDSSTESPRQDISKTTAVVSVAVVGVGTVNLGCGEIGV